MIAIKIGVLIWNMNRKIPTVIKINDKKSDFKKVSGFATKNNCYLSIERKVGIPFLIEKYKSRKALIILAFVVIFAIAFASQLVWNIQIEGCKNIDSNEIMKVLNENGVNKGKLKSRIDIENVLEKVKYNVDGISWIGAEYKGTNIIVRVVEAQPKPEINDESDYTNIVATKDGVVTKIIAENGTAMVKEGDEVKKGDILIGGFMQGLYTDKYYVNSQGSVKAKINYSKTVKIDKKEEKNDKTGKMNTKMSIKFKNFKINFYKRLSNFEIYDTIVASKKIGLFLNKNLPIELIQYKCYELTRSYVLNDYDMAKSKGESQAKEELNNIINGDIVNSETVVTENDSCFDVTVNYEVIEEIGAKEKINI